MKKLDLKNKKILITGANGFLGTHVVSYFKGQGATNLVVPSSKEFDLREEKNCQKIVKGVDIVIHLAAKVGGIGYNQAYPAEMFYDNMRMGIYLMHEAWKQGVEKFVAIGTICCYPKFTPVPFTEENLWDGYPEETNAPYGLAKKMLLVQSQAYRQQYGFKSIFLLPVNMYGPGDNFNPSSSHVIPALIKKFIEAKKKKEPFVTVWGTGNATREFLYVEDAAKAIYLATLLYDKPDPVNIGAGFEISIHDLVEKIKHITGYTGSIKWDSSKPDGQPRRMLNVQKAAKEFGFKSETDFTKGLKKTITWYEKQNDKEFVRQ
jgi:GDP-L-fucose synthase